jgi:hypothetical protein
MTARNRDGIVQAWIDAGPRELPESARHAISTTARTLPQRSRGSLLPATILASAAAVAVVATVVFVTTPRPAPNVGAVPGSIMLSTVGGEITLSYRIPVDLDVTVEDAFALAQDTPRAIIGFTESGSGLYGLGSGRDTGDMIPPEQRELPAGTRGVVVADVTNVKTHGLRGQLLGTTAAEFVDGIAAYPPWTVRDVSETTIAGLAALEASVVSDPRDWAHLDTPEADGTRIEMLHPSKFFVTTLGGTRLMVQVWAPSEAELQTWLPTAMQLVESFEFTAATDD